MKKMLSKVVFAFVVCLWVAVPAFAGEDDWCTVDASCKFDKSSVKWQENGSEITFTYMAIAQTPEEEKQFGEYYKVGRAKRVLYDVAIHRDVDNFFEICRTWLTDDAGNVVYESMASQGKKLVSKSQRIKSCYDMIVKDYIGLSAEDAYEIAMDLADDQMSNLNKSLPYLRVVAERGTRGTKLAHAQYLLGVCYYNGIGTTVDYDNAMLWLRKSAEMGNIRAASLLGEMYLRGTGTSQNYDVAVKYLKEAAERDDIIAVKNMAYCYSNGYGVGKSNEKAYAYMKKASQLGDEEAQQYVAQYEQQKQRQDAQNAAAFIGLIGTILKNR
ncbi:MAG: tetratricopeptide repeat protein [Synergistes sp.]|nr:tetratricopeptide repeat protein [Synergistes sp.]